MGGVMEVDLTKDEIRALLNVVKYARDKTRGNLPGLDGESAERKLADAIRPEDITKTIGLSFSPGRCSSS
jgi:hypothetical protein